MQLKATASLLQRPTVVNTFLLMRYKRSSIYNCLSLFTSKKSNYSFSHRSTTDNTNLSIRLHSPVGGLVFLQYKTLYDVSSSLLGVLNSLLVVCFIQMLNRKLVIVCRQRPLVMVANTALAIAQPPKTQYLVWLRCKIYNGCTTCCLSFTKIITFLS